MASSCETNKLQVKFESELEFPTNSRIGTGSFAECHKCWLKSDPSKRLLAVKIAKWENQSESQKKWQLQHLTKELRGMFQLCQETDAFVKVFHAYVCRGMFAGYIMEYCKYGSIRNFPTVLGQLNLKQQDFSWLIANWAEQVASGLNYLQTRASGAILHRDLAVDNVFIDASLNAKIADFGLHKGINSVATQRTLDIDRARGIERRPPETFDDPTKQPDQYGDRYQYGIFVIEAFCQLSLRQAIADRVEEFKTSVRTGKHLDTFDSLLDDSWYNICSVSERGQQLNLLRSTAKQIVRMTAHQLPERRATFAEVSGLWRLCDRDRMEVERLRALTALEGQPDATVERAEGRRGSGAVTVSLGDGARAEAAANVPLVPSKEPTTRTGLTVSIGTVIGDAHTFRQPDGSDVRVRQTVQPPLGDEVQLLVRSYSEQVADEDLLPRLCRCTQVVSGWQILLTELGFTEVDLSRLQMTAGPAASADSARLLLGLLKLRGERPLTICQLGEALKRFGCLDGLRILHERELSGSSSDRECV